MKKENKKDVLSHLDNLRLNKDVSKRENYGIFVNGERIKLSNGKVVWNKKNHASSALKNEFEKHIKPNYWEASKGYKYGTEEYKKKYDEYRLLCKKIDSIYDEMKNDNVIQFLPV